MKRRTVITLLAASLISFTSCCILEDRNQCPCFLSVKAQTDTDCIVSFYDGSTMLERRTIKAEDMRTGNNYIKIQKSDIRVSVVQQVSGMVYDDATVRCPLEKESAYLSASSVMVDTRCEEHMLECNLKEQYANVHISVTGSEEMHYPFSFRFLAESNGMAIYDLSSVSGQFVFNPAMDDDNCCSIRLPRQKSSENIRLFILDGNESVERIFLTECFESVGYDWTKEKLDDIDIVVDFSRSTLRFSTDDWDTETILDYRL